MAEEKDKEEKKKAAEEAAAQLKAKQEAQKESAELITKSNEAAERQEKANEDLSALLDRQEKLQIERTLGGEAKAGQPATTEEEKGIESAKKQLEGTGFEDIFDAKPQHPASDSAKES